MVSRVSSTFHSERVTGTACAVATDENAARAAITRMRVIGPRIFPGTGYSKSLRPLLPARMIRISLLTVLFAAQIAAAAPPATRFELPNGLRVWVQQDRTRPIALVQVTYKVGSLHESAGLTGIAHYVEHMVYRATENVRNEDSYGYI